MKTERILELLECERQCILRNSLETCNRDCINCDLLQDSDALLDMYDEVMSIISAQRPRVMTLEEVGEISVAWMETKTNDDCQPALITDVYWDDTVGVVTVDEDGEYYMGTQSYGVDWRCWTSRPTDEQRRTTPWE